MRYPNGKTYQKKENIEQNKTSAHRTRLTITVFIKEDILTLKLRTLSPLLHSL